MVSTWKREYMKKYYLENKEKMKMQAKQWNLDNPGRGRNAPSQSRLSKRIYNQKVGYRQEKTVKERANRSIKRKTRSLYPLTGNKCFCGMDAECRHHTTKPIKFDKFDYLCNEHHHQIHNKTLIKL